MEHDVVTQTRGAVDAHEDAVFDGGAEAHCQPVRPCAWPLIIGPRVGDQTPSFAKDIGGAGCGNTRSKKREDLETLSISYMCASSKRVLVMHSDVLSWYLCMKHL